MPATPTCRDDSGPDAAVVDRPAGLRPSPCPLMRRVWLALIVSSLGWGTAGVATRAVLDDGVGPLALATYRSLIAAAVVVVFLVVSRAGFPRSKTAWKVGLLMAVTNLAVPYILSNIALQHASAGFLGLTTALIPLLTAIVAHFALADERLDALKVLGLVVGLGGVAVLLTSGDSGLVGGGRPVLAGVLALVSVLSISVGGVYAKHHSGGYGSLEVTGVHFVVGTILIAIATLIGEGVPPAVSGHSWLLLGYMGVFATVVPFILYYWMLRSVSATFASIAGYLIPPIAVVAGMVFLDERLQRGLVVGGALILLGVVITDRAERRVKARL